MTLTSTPLAKPMSYDIHVDPVLVATITSDIRQGACTMYGFSMTDAVGAAGWLKIFDALTATPGTTYPDWLIPVKASTTVACQVFRANGAGVLLTSGVSYFAATVDGKGNASGPTDAIGRIITGDTRTETAPTAGTAGTAGLASSSIGGLGGTLKRIQDIDSTPQNDMSGTDAKVHAVEIDCTNNSGEAVYLKFWNSATPTVGTDDSVFTLKGFPGEIVTYLFPQPVDAFATAISMACVQGASDLTAVNPSGTVAVELILTAGS